MRMRTTSRWIVAVSLALACNSSATKPSAPSSGPAPDERAEPVVTTPAEGARPEATPPEATPPEATPPEATPPAPTPLPPEPAQPDLPPDGVAVRLAADLVALDRAAMTSVRGLIAALHLPADTAWRATESRSGKYLDIRVDGEQGPLELRLVMKDGTWEPPRGNSGMRNEPEVDGVELRGAVGLPSPSPAGATRVEVAAVDPGSTEREVVTEWGDHVYFRPMAAGGRWTLARYDGRAPFHYDEAERRALEDALIDLTRAMAAGTSAVDHLAARHAARVDPATGYYDFGAGILVVDAAGGVGVALVGPLRLPRLFAAHGMTMIRTSFAHDYGDMPEPLVGDRFTIHPGRYFFREPYARLAAEMGDPGEALFVAFSISPVVDAAP